MKGRACTTTPMTACVQNDGSVRMSDTLVTEHQKRDEPRGYSL